MRSSDGSPRRPLSASSAEVALPNIERRCVLHDRARNSEALALTERSLRARRPMCRIFPAAARCEASSRRFGRGLRTCSSEAYGRTKADVLGDATEEDGQILRRDGELRRLRLTDRASRGRSRRSRSLQNSFRANRFCVTASASKAGMVRTAPRCKRHRGREIVLNADEASVRRDRLHRPDQQDRRWFVAHGLRCRHIILTKPLKGCSQLKSWAMRIAGRAGMSKAKVGLARRLAVIMHRMLAEGASFNAAACLQRRDSSGRSRHQAFSKRSAFAGTMDHVRPYASR